MKTLIREARIHLLPTVQGTGLKLKLLNVLYHGRFVVVNPQMVNGTDVAPICLVVPTAEEMVAECRRLMRQEFSAEEGREREKILGKIYNNDTNLTNLLKLL